MTEQKLRRELTDCCRSLYDKGFFPGKDGNVSIRVDESTALITPNGVSKAILSEDMLVLMGLDGSVLSGGKPSSEAHMHLAAYRRRSDAGAVIHAHSQNIGAFALAGRPIDSRCAPFAYFHLGPIGEVPYITPGTREFHEAVEAQVSRGFSALLLLGHGSLVTGRDMADAYAKMDLFEAFAGMLLKAQMLGGAKPLTDEELARLSDG